MRRRRRSQGTWLPTIGNAVGQELTENDVTGVDSDVDVEDNGLLVTRLFQLTLDQPQEEATTSTPLSDVIGSEYFLKRIVGKLFAAIDDPSATPSPFFTKILVGAGFFVARAEAAEPDVPIGAGVGTAADVAKNYSPLETRTQREPWIWRRTWILQSRPLGISENPMFPRSTAGYNSVLDGPHIDAKTKRRISNDDRLWFAISAVRWPIFATGEEPAAAPQTISFHLDYRLFGSLRKAKTRGVF